MSPCISMNTTNVLVSLAKSNKRCFSSSPHVNPSLSSRCLRPLPPASREPPSPGLATPPHSAASSFSVSTCIHGSASAAALSLPPPPMSYLPGTSPRRMSAKNSPRGKPARWGGHGMRERWRCRALLSTSASSSESSIAPAAAAAADTKSWLLSPHPSSPPNRPSKSSAPRSPNPSPSPPGATPLPSISMRCSMLSPSPFIAATPPPLLEDGEENADSRAATASVASWVSSPSFGDDGDAPTFAKSSNPSSSGPLARFVRWFMIASMSQLSSTNAAFDLERAEGP
mmetsp:Transcript_60744/g.114321  ORF Transcript_60744/g.114321 Transcript_60744/m.114321 type:complete len:285 (-) Transcript_60744:237-1091(-)